MNGFTTRTFTVVITAGSSTDLGTIRLAMSLSEMTLTGKITDATTGAPIPGAEVAIQGGELAGRADFTGTYGISAIKVGEVVTVKVSADGYIGKSLLVRPAPWTKTIDIALTPHVTTGGLTGTVIDAYSKVPLEGVTLALLDEPSVSTTTNSAGSFTFSKVKPGVRKVNLELPGYSARVLTTPVTLGTTSDVGNVALSVSPLAASVQGAVWDAAKNVPFAGVDIRTSGTDIHEAVTAADGKYSIAGVEPGEVTVAAGSIPNYTNARFTATVEPGGVLVFNPALSTTFAVTLDLDVRSDKVAYKPGDTVSAVVNLLNRQAAPLSGRIYLHLTDPAGATVSEKAVALDLAADGARDVPLTLQLPVSAQTGNYLLIAEAFADNGLFLNRAVKGLGVAVSQVAVTPLLPTVFSAGANQLSFSLTNSGAVPVSQGSLTVTLKDPDGLVASTSSLPFSIDPGQSTVISHVMMIPALKFGTYTLSYAQNDETKTGETTELLLPNTLAVSALYDDASHRVRNAAHLTVSVSNTGRFNLGSPAQTGTGLVVTVSVPDAAYSETKALSPAPVPGSPAGSILLYSFTIPETMIAGHHGTKITVALPSGSNVVQTTRLAIMESSLSLSPIQGAFSTGDTISPVLSNNGGVDTQVQYSLRLHDAKSALLAEKVATESVAAAATLPVGIAIPAGAVEGSYTLVVQYKDLKTGKEGVVPNALFINGVKGSLQVLTDKENYLLTENLSGLSTISNSGTPLQEGNLHLQVTTGPGSQKMKTWTTQADFQSGVRSGVDTYGVNDWIIPDDDFGGTTLDASRWWSSGNVSIQSGKLLLDTTQATASSSVTSKWMLEGDFDVQVDFPSNNSADWPGASLSVGYGGGSWINVSNGRYPGYASQVSIDGLPQSYVYRGNFSSSGRFRITRSTNTVVTYYWGGTSWVELNRYTSPVLANPCTVEMSLYRAVGYAGATAAFDNLRVVSGRIKTQKQTVDSVRLLPLNDNFDDGVLNEDRWIDKAVPPAVESLGVVHLQSNASSQDNAIVLKAALVGDYAATTQYRNFSVEPTGVHSGSYRILGTAGTTQLHSMRHSDAFSRASGNFVAGMSAIDNNYMSDPEVPDSSDSGLLRVRRTANSGYHEYWNGANWATLHIRPGISTAPTVISLLARSVDVLPTVKTDVDRFYTDKGTYTVNGTLSLKFDGGTSNTRWLKLFNSLTQPVGTSIKFRTRTAETEAGVATSTWSDYLTASGSSIASPASRWIEIEATFSTTDTNVTPLLHDVTVTYEANSGEILWQTDVPASLVEGAASDVKKTIGTLGVTGKLYFGGTLTSSTGQTVAAAEYPFYVEQGNIQVYLAADKKIYRPGETVTITGKVANLSGIAAAGLTAVVQGTGLATRYADTFDLPANSAHPFSITTTAGNDGIYQLAASVTQNSTTLADITDQYEVDSPSLTANLTAPDTVGNTPFTISVSVSNTGRVSAATRIRVVDDSGDVIGDQPVTLAAGESTTLQYTRQISGSTMYTAAVTGDLLRTLTKQVTYAVVATDSSVSAKIFADKVSYQANEQVTLASTLSASFMKENLSTLVTVINSQGQAVYSATAAIPVLVQGQAVTNKNYWNSGSYPPGTYLATLRVHDSGGAAISTATCNVVISSTAKPFLKGTMSLDKQSILTGESITVSYSVTNAGNVDLADVSLSIRTVNVDEQAVNATLADQATLVIGGRHTNSGRIDARDYSAKDYLVVLSASVDGVEETLAGAFFRVEGAPSAPALSGPGNGTDVETFTPALSVSNAADPNNDRLTYEYEIYGDSGLTSLVTSGALSETAGTTSWTVPVPLAENQTHYWRARAYDGRFYSPWMAPASFRVNTANDPPSAPTVSSPLDGTDVALLTPMLSVGNAGDPDSANLTYNFDLARDPAFTETIASARGIASGEAATSWRVPENLQENTMYYWRAQADDWLVEGPWSTTARFFVNTSNDAPSAPTVIAPATGSTITALATDAVIANSTDPDSPVLSYYLEADTVPTFDSAHTIRSGSVTEGDATTIWHMDGLQDNTRYHLRAKASDGTAESPWSAVTGFFANTANDPPTIPILANPSNGAGVNTFAPTLSVHNSTDLDHDAVTYQFELYGDAALNNQIARADSIAEAAPATGWEMPVSLAENEIYYWRARAFDGALYSDWTAAASFMVNTANDAPGAPGLSSPAEGSSVVTPTPMLAVVNAVDPDSDNLTYEFQVYSAGSLVTAMAGVTGDTSGITTWTPGAPLADKTAYQWRARAHDGDSYGPWTAMAAFTVHVPKTNITATLDFDPDTLNRAGRGTWVVAYIELPAGYQPSEVDISSVRLQGSIPAEARPYAIGDRDGDGIPDLMVKFKRSELIDLLREGDRVPVQVTGKVGSLLFEGMDVIRVIE